MCLRHVPDQVSLTTIKRRTGVAVVGVHGAVVIRKPDPQALPGAQPEFAAVLRRDATGVVAHRLAQDLYAVGMGEAIQVRHPGCHLLWGVARLGERLGGWAGDGAGDQAVLPDGLLHLVLGLLSFMEQGQGQGRGTGLAPSKGVGIQGTRRLPGVHAPRLGHGRMRAPASQHSRK